MSRAPFAVAVALSLAACGGEGGDPSFLYASTTPEEPTAGTWRTWAVTDLETVRPPAPPHSLSGETADELQSLRVRTAARGPGEEANVDFWDAGTCLRWNEYQRDRVAARSVNPPKASRGYAMVSAAMYDAMVAAWDAKFLYLRPRPSAYEDPPTVYGVEHDSPSYVSERAAMSAAAHDVLNFLFPLDTATTDRMLADAMDADLDAGVHFPSDVLAGRTLGEAVAARVIARALADNGQDSFQDSITATYAESGVDGRWRRTPPGNVFPPLLPGWGRVTPWLLESGDAIRPPPPPAYGSDEWNLQRDEVLAAALALSPDRADLATFWADGAGTYTPPGHWNEIACDAATGEGLDECRFARMLAALNTAQADAFVACWECKYFYDVERPVSVIRRDVPGQSGFLSFIETPPFPSYPSGHSTTSGAASQVLGYFFPDFAIDFAVMANEAKDSRLYGGIHFRFDNDTGLDMGRTIGTFSIARLAADGADAP